MSKAPNVMGSSGAVAGVYASSTALGVVRVDSRGMITHVDTRTAEILGYAPEEILGQNFVEFSIEEERSQAKANFEQRRSGVAGVTEYRMRRKNGTEQWIALATAPMLDPAGVFLGLTAFVTDIEERKRQQTMAGHERRLLRQLAANLPLTDVLDDLCVTLETVSRRPLQASVMLADGYVLKCVAAPSLPPRFREERAVIRLDEDDTPCAMAVRSGSEVIIGDTVEAGAAQCCAYGFGAVWSYPIVQDEETLGTLAMFLPAPGAPDAEDKHAIEFALQVARLALAHERKAIALRESELRFRDYAEMSADWFWEQDAEFRFTDVGYGSGLRPMEPAFYGGASVGKHRWDLPFVNVPEGFWEAHRRLLEAGQPFNNLRLQRRDGDLVRHFEISGRPLFDGLGHLIGYRGIGRDITEQMRSREELEKAIGWLAQAVRAGGIGLWERDIEPWTFRFRDNWRALFGYTEDEIEDSAEAFDRLVHPDDLPRIHTAGRAYVTHPGSEYETRFRIRHKDGSWRWVLSRGNVMNETATGGRTLVGCHLDITAQMQTEQKITELAALLEMRVKARTASLEEANNELDAFNFSVSHDLRTPLRAIEGFSQALLEDCQESLDATGREYLRRICRSTARMGELIDALYELSRLSRAPLRLGPVDLSAVARELIAELSAQDPQREVDIEIAATPLAEGDARLLRIVLANLLGNAWKFTGKAVPARIVFDAQRDDHGRVVYSVRDNGAGFDMRFADKLFRIFHRLHREEEFPGQGVGLTTVQRIVARHGGRVWGEAERGVGARLHFTLWTDSAFLADAQESAEDA